MVACLTLIIGLLIGYLFHNEIYDYKNRKVFERAIQRAIKKKESGN